MESNTCSHDFRATDPYWCKCQYCGEVKPVHQYDKLKITNGLEDLYKAITKIEEGNLGSAKNFIYRYINSFNVK